MKLQCPKGMRDFFPQEMAWQNHLMAAWQRVSVRNGFEQVDGPIFESLELYEKKSGQGIVNELFHFTDRGQRELAIRPEFTPTLARMVAAQANALPKPIKWFSIPNLCRAERPQRGRLREFLQWNIDILGPDSALADAECIFTTVDLLQELGLGPDDVRIKISHREVVRQILLKLGVAQDSVLQAFELLDRRDKIEADAFAKQASGLGLESDAVKQFDGLCRTTYPVADLPQLREASGISDADIMDLQALDSQLQAFGVADWCEYDLGIVRGLAYYTGTVFEVHECSGAQRAMAGGGRYDHLINTFGGPNLPAVGLGMGDVVLSNVLADKGLVPKDLLPKPDVFVIAMSEQSAQRLPGIVATLRSSGLHARFSYRASRNLGKLLKEAASVGARYAAIISDRDNDATAADMDTVTLKDMTTGQQLDAIKVRDLSDRIK